MKIAFFDVARARPWNHIMKPQSPVMPDTPFSWSSHRTASVNSAITSGVISPLWHIANVRPGTTR